MSTIRPVEAKAATVAPPREGERLVFVDVLPALVKFGVVTSLAVPLAFGFGHWSRKVPGWRGGCWACPRGRAPPARLVLGVGSSAARSLPFRRMGCRSESRDVIIGHDRRRSIASEGTRDA